MDTVAPAGCTSAHDRMLICIAARSSIVSSPQLELRSSGTLDLSTALEDEQPADTLIEHDHGQAYARNRVVGLQSRSCSKSTPLTTTVAQ